MVGKEGRMGMRGAMNSVALVERGFEMGCCLLGFMVWGEGRD